MSTVLPTQGPWSIAFSRRAQVNGDLHVIRGADDSTVAFVSAWTDDAAAEGKANASLLLAARDLQEQLQRVYDALGGECFDWEPVRAALAKASGGTS